MTVDLTKVFECIISLAAALITTFLIPYIKARTSAEQFKKLKDYAMTAVKAAEMIYNGTGRGAEKKAYVQAFLAEKGYKINLAEVENAIEAAVLEMNKSVEEYK